MSARRITGALLVIIGAAAAAACLAAASAGMRDVMVTDGGSCGSGGPYVVANQCSPADVRLLMTGIFGCLVALAVCGVGTAFLGSPSSIGLLAWTGLFGLLGWNFIDLGLHPPAQAGGGGGGWLLTGVVFWVMAAGGLLAMIGKLRAGLRPDRSPSTVQPLVRAAAYPVTGDWLPGPMPVDQPAVAVAAMPAAERLRSAAWLVATMAGVAAGIAASSSLITLLR